MLMITVMHALFQKYQFYYNYYSYGHFISVDTVILKCLDELQTYLFKACDETLNGGYYFD